MEGMKSKDREFLRKRDEVYVDFPEKANVMDWEVENISIGGFRVSGSVDGEPGTELECVLTFPAAGVDIEAKARVVWSRDSNPPRLGLKFENLGPGDRLKLAHALYLRRKLKDAA
jgi:hypothetical protein